MSKGFAMLACIALLAPLDLPRRSIGEGVEGGGVMFAHHSLYSMNKSLDYVYLDGTMCVDTGIYPTMDTVMEFGASFTSPNNDNHIGTPAASDLNDFRYIQSGNDAVFDYGSRRIVSNLRNIGFPFQEEAGGFYGLDVFVEAICDAPNGRLTIWSDGFEPSTFVGTSIDKVPSGYTLKIGGSNGRYNKMRVKYFNVKQGGVYVMKLTPIFRSGEKYLLDEVSKSLFGDSISGGGLA